MCRDLNQKREEWDSALTCKTWPQLLVIKLQCALSHALSTAATIRLHIFSGNHFPLAVTSGAARHVMFLTFFFVTVVLSSLYQKGQCMGSENQALAAAYIATPVQTWMTAGPCSSTDSSEPMLNACRQVVIPYACCDCLLLVRKESWEQAQPSCPGNNPVVPRFSLSTGSNTDACDAHVLAAVIS